MPQPNPLPVPAGIDADGVTAWLHDRVPGLVPPLRFDQIAGGHSNLTYSVRDGAEGHWVLRRPPLGQVLASAHDMGREHRIITALGPTAVPVPGVVGLCDDPDVIGAPFYVMDFVDGLVCRGAADAARLDEDSQRRACRSLIEVLVAIHSVDLTAVGLDDLARHDSYIARQLKRWNGQFLASTEQVPGGSFAPLGEVHDRLAAAIPPQTRGTIVHGDYRLDNCILGPDGTVAAVLDWEICTLGDPLADLGLLAVYWADPGDPAMLPQGEYLTGPGFMRRHELLALYEELSGHDVSHIGYYVAFGYWKLGCILAGVYARYAGGSMGSGVAESTIHGFAALMQATHDAAAAELDKLASSSKSTP